MTKPGHDAVKNRAVEEAVVHVLVKIGHRQRRVLFEQFNGEGAVRSIETYHDD